MKTHCIHGHVLKNNIYTWSDRIICKTCVNISQKKHKAKYPWMQHYSSAKDRCLNKQNKGYRHYGDRGIKFLMTKSDFKFLWFRDRASLLQQPSIDRIDNDGNYQLDNCRFIEMPENSGKEMIGEKNHATKLTEKDVLEIRKLLNQGLIQKTIGAKFGIAKSTVSCIATHVTWKHIL